MFYRVIIGGIVRKVTEFVTAARTLAKEVADKERRIVVIAEARASIILSEAETESKKLWAELETKISKL